MEKINKNKYKMFFFIYFILLLGIAFLRFPDIRNELKYFIITDQMVQSKNYFILKYFNNLYPDKPPIYFWILGSIRIFFKNDFYSLSLIFGSIIPAGIVSFINFKLIKEFWNEKMAYIATGIYITLPYILGVSMVLRMDFLMSMFITLAIYLFFSFYYNKIKINFLNLTIFYASMAMGVLIKGGAGIAIPLISIISFLAFQNDFSFFKKIKIFKGILLIFTMLGFWIYTISLNSQGIQYISLLLGRETIGRMIKAKTHIKGGYYYLEQILLLLFPLTLFFIGKICVLIKNIKKFKEFNKIDKISFTWFLPNFIFFSLLSGKLAIYMLPILAPGVILALSFIDKKYAEKSLKVFKGIFTINLSTLVIIILLLPYYNYNYTLKPIISYLKGTEENVISYKFQDVKNISFEIGKKNIKDYSFKELENVSGKNFIICKNKYLSQLKNKKYILILKNKSYSILLSQ